MGGNINKNSKWLSVIRVKCNYHVQTMKYASVPMNYGPNKHRVAITPSLTCGVISLEQMNPLMLLHRGKPIQIFKLPDIAISDIFILCKLSTSPTGNKCAHPNRFDQFFSYNNSHLVSSFDHFEFLRSE